MYKYKWRRFSISGFGITNDHLARKGLNGCLGNKTVFSTCFGLILISAKNVQLHFNYIDCLHFYGRVTEDKVSLMCNCPFYK